MQASATLILAGERARTETGEVQLTDYGISGIPVFQLSRYAVRALEEGCSVMVSLDFLPGYERESLYSYLEWRMEQCPYKTLQQSLIGLIPDRLIPLAAPQRQTSSVWRNSLRIFRLLSEGRLPWPRHRSAPAESVRRSLQSIWNPAASRDCILPAKR